MEKNKITTREELKTYFQSGDYPTQSEFAELIDSLRHKEDFITNKDIVIIANSLATLDSGYIQYFINNVGDLKFPLVISQQDAEDHMIELSTTDSEGKKQYFFGKGPYTIKAKEFPTEELGETEYYYLYCQAGSNSVQRLFGNNLPTIPDGFELGTLEGKMLYLQLYKQNYGQKINIVNTNIKFVNKTEAAIQYGAYAGSWSNIYTSEDIVTDHYNVSDELSFYYKADLREIDRSIECKVYNADNDNLLMTAYLNAEQNNVSIWGGGTAKSIRNIRIECDYQIL